MKKKLRVALSFLCYPFTMAHFFWRALARRDDVELWVCGPFTGNQIPWKGGMTVSPKYVRVPDYILTGDFVNQSIPFHFVKSSLPWKPDLWLQVDAGFHFSNKPDAGVVVLVETDPHVLKRHYDLPKSYSDIVFCMQTPYIETGEFYLPYACDPTIHYPMDDVDKIYDACLVGLQYETRTRLVNQLRRDGLNVYYDTGPIYDEYRFLYNQSKVALSWSSLQDLPSRVFEAMGLGVPLVSNRVPDLSTHFVENEHYLGFDDVEEARAKVHFLLSDSGLREKMSGDAYRKVLAQHTWDIRVSQIFERCGLDG